MSHEEGFSAIQQADKKASYEFSVLTELIDSTVCILSLVYSSNLFLASSPCRPKIGYPGFTYLSKDENLLEKYLIRFITWY